MRVIDTKRDLVRLHRTMVLNDGAIKADYPRSYTEFRNWFTCEDDCRRYLATVRWPQRFVCPACRWTGEPWETTRGLFVCGRCSHQTSVTSGTIFAGTRTPLLVWLKCAWVLATSSDGSSAIRLQEFARVSNYRTLWAILQRYRRAMYQPARCRLTRPVELSFFTLEALDDSSNGSVPVNNLVMCLREFGPAGRVRMSTVENSDVTHVPELIRTFVQPSTLIRFQSFRGHAGEPNLWMPAVLAARTHRPTPESQRLATAIEDWLRNTHGGAIHSVHLNYYLGEFLYRHNRRMTADSALNFRRLLGHALWTPPAPVQTARPATSCR